MPRKRAATESKQPRKRQKRDTTKSQRLNLTDLPNEILKKIATFALLDDDKVPKHFDCARLHTSLALVSKHMYDISHSAFLHKFPWCYVETTYSIDEYTGQECASRLQAFGVAPGLSSLPGLEDIVPRVRILIRNDDVSDNEQFRPGVWKALFPLDMRNLSSLRNLLQMSSTSVVSIELNPSRPHHVSQTYLLQYLTFIRHDLTRITVKGPSERIPVDFHARLAADLGANDSGATHINHLAAPREFAIQGLKRHEDAEVYKLLEYNDGELLDYEEAYDTFDKMNEPNVAILWIHADLLRMQAARNLIMLRIRYRDCTKLQVL